MQRRCAACGKPATQCCECGGCERFMCEEHTTRRMPASAMPPGSGEGSQSRGQAFCPEHAYLADPLNR